MGGMGEKLEEGYLLSTVRPTWSIARIYRSFYPVTSTPFLNNLTDEQIDQSTNQQTNMRDHKEVYHIKNGLAKRWV